jgi:two-component system, chemotaxis family, response regulator WspF
MLKIAIVNDSMLAAESLRRVVVNEPDYQLVWVAYDGREALHKCREVCPDIILMDLIMPEMDGVEATRAISAEFECAILIVTASVHGHAGKVFEAMGGGALDAVNTPILGSSGEGEGRSILIKKINAIATLLHGKPFRRSKTTTVTTTDTTVAVNSQLPLIAIGASTGGPSALRDILRALPPDPGVAIAIVQHVDEQFVASFTDWLDNQTSLPVRLARPGEPLARDTVLVCGREEHLVLGADGLLAYQAEPTDLAYRPSVDVFFNSLVDNYNNQSVAALLTGMGKDGAQGLKSLRDKGWWTIAQDQATCAVYGMPKAAKEIDAAEEILPLEDIGARLAEWAEQASRRSAG